jgi:hypothetical protein
MTRHDARVRWLTGRVCNTITCRVTAGCLFSSVLNGHCSTVNRRAAPIYACHSFATLVYTHWADGRLILCLRHPQYPGTLAHSQGVPLCLLAARKSIRSEVLASH